jgi:hypothetical protein
MFNELKEVLPIIEHGAPILATALGSPLAGLGTKFAMSLLGLAFGADPKDPASISAAIAAHPEPQNILSRLEANFGDIIKNKYNIQLPSKAEINIKLEWENTPNIPPQ